MNNDEKRVDEKVESDEESKDKISRREFLKIGVGVAAVAAGATALMGRIPLPGEQSKSPTTRPTTDIAEPIVAAVDGDQVTVMSGHVAVKVRDAGLAAQIADKLREGI